MAFKIVFVDCKRDINITNKIIGTNLVQTGYLKRWVCFEVEQYGLILQEHLLKSKFIN